MQLNSRIIAPQRVLSALLLAIKSKHCSAAVQELPRCRPPKEPVKKSERPGGRRKSGETAEIPGSALVPPQMQLALCWPLGGVRARRPQTATERRWRQPAAAGRTSERPAPRPSAPPVARSHSRRTAERDNARESSRVRRPEEQPRGSQPRRKQVRPPAPRTVRACVSAPRSGSRPMRECPVHQRSQ